MFHCEENTGYAMETLEKVFFNAAIKAGISEENIYWSFKSKNTNGDPHILACNYFDADTYEVARKTIIENEIELVLAFDLGFPCPLIQVLKDSGVKHLIAYWGASMSSINSGLKLELKKLEYYLTKNKPDEFIFESEAMRRTATHGRGVKFSATNVINLGVDTSKFYPNYGRGNYANNVLNIPTTRKIVFYSGHMEERKGVRVIVNAALHLIDELNFKNIHFVICGNKNSEANAYEKLLENNEARDYVTFAGYRSDLPDLMRSSHVGVIASTGWDSFTMSSIEMMSSGLPMIVSNLQGLSETIKDGVNGFLLPPGNHVALADRIIEITTNTLLASQFSEASRKRAEMLFSRETQIDKLSKLFSE